MGNLNSFLLACTVLCALLHQVCCSLGKRLHYCYKEWLPTFFIYIFHLKIYLLLRELIFIVHLVDGLLEIIVTFMLSHLFVVT